MKIVEQQSLLSFRYYFCHFNLMTLAWARFFCGCGGCVFLSLKSGLPAAATALGTGGSFFNLYTTILGRNFLLPTSCMFLVHISIVVRYRLSKSRVCAQPKRTIQYFDRFSSALRFRVVYRLQNSTFCAQPRNGPAHAACFPLLA